MSRNLLMWLEEIKLEAAHLIDDHETKFTVQFDRLFETTYVRVVKSPVMVTNANAFVESWILMVKREFLDCFTYFGFRHARLYRADIRRLLQ